MKPIPNFSEYFATEDGRVYSALRKWRRKGRFLKLSIATGGYRRVNLYKDGKRHHKFVHRLILEAFVGPCPDGMEGCHNNGDPADNRLENLRWDTRSCNILDAIRHGTFVDNRGEKNGMAKLNRAQVEEIRCSPEIQRCLANRFGVSRATIGMVRIGKIWK